jgi:hypothetical protein
VALSFNIHRRHLTAEQKRELIAKLLKAKPEASNVTVAKQVKADDKTVAKVRRDLESTSEIPRLEKTIGADRRARKVRLAKKAKPAPSTASTTVPQSSVPANTESMESMESTEERDKMSARDKRHAERRRQRARQDIDDLVDHYDIDGFAQLLFDAVGQNKANAVVTALQKLLVAEDGAAANGNDVDTDTSAAAAKAAHAAADDGLDIPPHLRRTSPEAAQ